MLIIVKKIIALSSSIIQLYIHVSAQELSHNSTLVLCTYTTQWPDKSVNQLKCKERYILMDILECISTFLRKTMFGFHHLWMKLRSLIKLSNQGVW